MAGAALVAALGLELDDSELGAALLTEDQGLHGLVGQRVTVEDGIAVDDEQRLQVDGDAVLGGQALHEEPFALRDAVLLSTCLDDRVHAHSEDGVAAGVSALALERRRPPLRPRRRVLESSSSASSPDPSESPDPPEPAPTPPEPEPAAPEPEPPAAPEPDPELEPPDPAEPPTSTSEATADVRPTSSMRTRCFSPTYFVPPRMEMM